MSDVARRRAILTVCLNNLDGCYVSLLSFLGFKKQQERNDILMTIMPSKSSKYSKKKKKEIHQGIGLDQNKQARSGRISFLVRKSVKNGKRIFACHKKVLKNFLVSFDLIYKKTPLDLEIQYLLKNKSLRTYIAQQMKEERVRFLTCLVLANQQYRR